MDISNEIATNIDLEGAKERFMGNEGLFKKFLLRFPQENRYGELKKQIEDNNAEGAFQVAHTMKGVVGNLSLIAVGDVLNPIVEVLRAGSFPENEQMEELEKVCTHSLEIIKYIEEHDVKLF